MKSKAGFLLAFAFLMSLEVARGATPTVEDAIEMVFGIKEPPSDLRSGPSSSQVFQLDAVQETPLSPGASLNVLDKADRSGKLIQNVLTFFEEDDKSVWTQLLVAHFGVDVDYDNTVDNSDLKIMDSKLAYLADVREQVPEKFRDTAIQFSEYLLDLSFKLIPANFDKSTDYDPAKLAAYFFTVTTLLEAENISKGERVLLEKRKQKFWTGLSKSAADFFHFVLDLKESEIEGADCQDQCCDGEECVACDVKCSKGEELNLTISDPWLRFEVDSSSCVKANVGAYGALAYTYRLTWALLLETCVIGPINIFLKQSNQPPIEKQVDNRKFPFTDGGVPCDIPCALNDDDSKYWCAVREENRNSTWENCSPIDHAGGKQLTISGSVCDNDCARYNNRTEYYTCDVGDGWDYCSPQRADNYVPLNLAPSKGGQNKEDCGLKIGGDDPLLKAYLVVSPQP